MSSIYNMEIDTEWQMQWEFAKSKICFYLFPFERQEL